MFPSTRMECDCMVTVKNGTQKEVGEIRKERHLCSKNPSVIPDPRLYQCFPLRCIVASVSQTSSLSSDPLNTFSLKKRRLYQFTRPLNRTSFRKRKQTGNVTGSTTFPDQNGVLFHFFFLNCMPFLSHKHQNKGKTPQTTF